MRFLPVVLLLTALCFGDITYPVRGDGTGSYLTMQACEDANSISFAGLGGVTCDMDRAGTINGNLLVQGQTNVSTADKLRFISSLPHGQAIMGLQSGTYAINIQTSYTEFINVSATNSAGTIMISTAGSPAVGVIISRCYFLNTGTNKYGFSIENAATEVTIRASIFVNTGSSTTSSAIYTYNGANTLNLYNVVLKGYARGIANLGGTPTAPAVVAIKNTIVDAADAFFGTNTYTHTTTACREAGAGCTLNGITDFGYDTDGYHITTASAMYNAGTNLSSDVPMDIDGQTWSVWSIGADDPTPTATSRPCGGALSRMGIMPRRRCQ